MKSKIAIASAFVAASSLATAEIVINEFLSFEGFIDMSYAHTDYEIDGTDGFSESDNSSAIDQVEISWLFDFDPVTAQVDIEYEESDEGNVEAEQAFVTYHLDNGGAITAGRYASMLGFEAFEPTGLYQYSLSYEVAGIGDVSLIPTYAQGVKYTHETDTTFFGISLQDEAFDLDGGRFGGDNGDLENESSSYAIEIAGSVDAGHGLTLFLGGVYEDGEENAAGGEADSYVINAYGTMETGEWIFAAEVNYGESDRGSTDAVQFLVMANVAYSDEASVTGRVSYIDIDGSDPELLDSQAAEIEVDFWKYTLAHNYAFTDNLRLITEVSYVDGSVAEADFESLEGAVELTFTF